MGFVMDKKFLCFSCALAAICIIPELGFSDNHTISQGKDLLEGTLDKEVISLVKTLFGYPTKIAGVLACAYGVLQTYFSCSPKPMMMWGGVALVTFFMPKILEMLFEIKLS